MTDNRTIWKIARSTSISPVKLADISPSIAGGGLETVERVTITVDAKWLYFLDGRAKPVNTLVVNDVAALKDLVFVPKEHFSGPGTARHPSISSIPRCRWSRSR